MSPVPCTVPTQYDIIHCHDWQSAPIAWGDRGAAKAVFTIHNLSYGADLIGRAMQACSVATTVSPTYAREVGGQRCPFRYIRPVSTPCCCVPGHGFWEGPHYATAGYWGMGFGKAALGVATTVSPTYAREVGRPTFSHVTLVLAAGRSCKCVPVLGTGVGKAACGMATTVSPGVWVLSFALCVSGHLAEV